MESISYLNLGQKEKIRNIKFIDELEINNENISWININTDNPIKEFEKLNEKLNIPSIFFDYIVRTSHRTKIEEYNSIIYINSYLINSDDDDLISYDNLNILVKDNYIITLNNPNNKILNRIMENISKNSKEEFDTTIKLLLKIIYEIVEEYDYTFDILEKKIDKIDSVLVMEKKQDIINELYILRKDIIYIERYIKPYKTIVKFIYDILDITMDKKLEYSFKYLENEIENIVESINISEELTTEIIDTINNLANEKTNSIMKTLTIWSTIFLPITFLSSVFGMNFKYMTGIEWEYSFHLFWAISFFIVVIMILYFKKKNY